VKVTSTQIHNTRSRSPMRTAMSLTFNLQPCFPRRKMFSLWYFFTGGQEAFWNFWVSCKSSRSNTLRKLSPTILLYHRCLAIHSRRNHPSTKISHSTTEDISRITDKLMNGLGLSSYIGQDGDVGSHICRPLALLPSCKAVHVNFNMIERPEATGNSEVSPSEQKGLERAEDFSERASAYALEHGTRPATNGFALHSSPLALLVWITEKFITWTDTTPDLDDILDSVTYC
jgi:hypothetical protein